MTSEASAITPAFPMSLAERAALQRRTLRILVVGQVVGAAALGAAITVGGFVVEDIVGVSTPWVGISTAAVTAGSGVMAQVLSRVMRRRGRRIGMQLGYGLAAVGGVVACLGVQGSVLPVFLVGLLLYGAGSATNLLARYAATDLAEPEQRGRAMGRILFASTFGAVFGPTLVVPAEHLGVALFGLNLYAGPWLFSSFFFACAAVNVAVRLRPDPLLVSAAEHGASIGERPIRLRESARAIAASPAARLALGAMVTAQAVMVGVMAMTPIDMKAHDHEAVSSLVVSVHIAGMFAFSPLVGRYADRRGRMAALRAGALVLLAACGLSALSSNSVPLMFVAMFALGVGWTLALIGGSSLLIEHVPWEHRVPVQGTADLTTAVCGGLASVVYGVVMNWAGFTALALGSAVLTLPVLLGVLLQRRTFASTDAVT
ncbi:Riboflavin transporter RfnT [Mycolicibacterium vanbaalenii]|uniref:Riboflavin transporter RfnT n=1 Tax=Mycolicibacterium vanbaalenii TaxID=110539 RepID=A0A5S9R8B2_MYCVN|nr:MFS transporter [Mycolicibacterium vanbaalenii]CAA0131879.1 Riboflavin transporter RfnT [Mycolicibacterium vanbaalenii]